MDIGPRSAPPYDLTLIVANRIYTVEKPAELAIVTAHAPLILKRRPPGKSGDTLELDSVTIIRMDRFLEGHAANEVFQWKAIIGERDPVQVEQRALGTDQIDILRDRVEKSPDLALAACGTRSRQPGGGSCRTVVKCGLGVPKRLLHWVIRPFR